MDLVKLTGLAALLVLLAGCGNVCDRMCETQAEVIEGCLATWELTWPELSYDNQDHYLDRCHAVWGDALEALEDDDPERDVLTARCQRELETARSDSDCESLLSIDP